MCSGLYICTVPTWFFLSLLQLPKPFQHSFRAMAQMGTATNEAEEARQPLLSGSRSSLDRNEAATTPSDQGHVNPQLATPPGPLQSHRAGTGEQPASSTQSQHVLEPPAPQQATAAPEPPSQQGSNAWATPHPEDPAVQWLSAAIGMPSVANQWSALRPYLACWLVSSVMNLMIFMMVDATTTAFLFAEISAIIGVVAAGRAIIPACREGLDLLSLCKQLHVCAALAMMMDMFTLLITDTVLLTLAFNCPEGEQQVCDMAKPAAAFFTFILGSHGLLSMHTARGAFLLIRLLNPITSGQLTLD